MKKLCITLSFLFCLFAFAQEGKQKNYTEIKLNALSTALGTVEIEFERTLNSSSSFGVSVFSTFDDTGEAFSYDYDSGVTGFYRYYIGKNYASGLFFEGFGMFHSTRYPLRSAEREITSDLLVGLGIGYKWVSKKGIVLQANFSPGINLFDDSISDISGRAGVSIGYRF